MSRVIEDTLKALTEFESQLDSAKATASDANHRMVREAGEWVETAKAAAIAEAQRLASETVSAARREAEAAAESIKKQGESTMKDLERSLSRHKREAADLVIRRLLGEAD